MGVFENCSVLLELKDLPFKEKKKLKSAVTANGGSISFVVNKKCSLVVTSSVSMLSSNRLRSIQKYQTPVVGLDYVLSCVDQDVLLPVDEYKLDASSSSSVLLPQRPEFRVCEGPSNEGTEDTEQCLPSPRDSPVPEERNDEEESRIFTELDSDVPEFPEDFQVAKYAIFQKRSSSSWCVLELQSTRTKLGRRYRVVRYWKDDLAAKNAAVKDQLVFLSTEKALEVYESLTKGLDSSGLQRKRSFPPEAPHFGSAPLQHLLLEEKLNTGSVSQEVAVFVETLWTEALGRLDTVLSVPINKLSLNDVSRAEGLLLQAQKNLQEGNISKASSLLEEVYNLLPHKGPRLLEPDIGFLSQKLDLCQLIRDVLNVSEMTLRSPEPSCVGKYRALRCSIETLPPDSLAFQNIAGLQQDSPVQIHQIMRVSRGAELQSFKAELGNIRPLLHSSSPSNFVGILSRGLLLPRVGVEHHGIERTDAGNLGSGIYFSDSVRTSLKYSKPSETDGSRLLLVCDVALGRCKDVHKRDLTLSQAPEGHHSVHGVRRAQNPQSDFEDDEFVVYSPDQVKIKYVIRFSVEGDHLKDFHPAVDTSAEACQPVMDQESLPVVDGDMENLKNPLEDVTAGLLDSSGQQLPLQAVHVKCKLMDLLSQVIIFQKYTNLSSVPIEAKYVFPLDDSAAVCGFEAFINGKHVVGQVKEKETARREYRQAIERGHGAYLMDQDAPDVFTISVGNLPPGATVLIKVTFVSELVVKDGSILFSLPGSVAPWQEDAALKQTSQVSVKKVCVTDEAATSREFTLDMSVEMPNKISELHCITHQIKMKRTDCKAVVSVLPGQVMGPDGFQLSVGLSEVHLPRMWVEKHPDKESQACMLVFYPDFELDSGSEASEVVLLLDTSESMRGETLRLAQRIALQVLRKLQNSTRVNVVLFGTDHTDAFLKAQPLSDVRQAAENFIERCSPVGGGTELWRPLRALGLLPPSRGVRNLLLVSDGHIQNLALTLQLLHENAPHSRLFTCGLSPTANRHMLRALAQAGGGAYEFFDTKTKHTWAEKVLRQVKRMSSPGCSSISVKWQQFNPAAPPPVQAPKQLNALFNDHHTLVYGLVPHCTQATLVGDLRGQELQTMVSTTELQKTRGTFLHKLTARALIRDYEDGSLETTEAEHEGKKAELKSFIVELSKEFSVLSQFTSFVAIEERDQLLEDGVTDVPKLIAEEDVDILPYISWTSPQDTPIPTIEGDGLLQTCSFDEVMMDIDRNNFEEYDVSYYCLPQAVSQRLDIEDSYFSEDDKMSRSERAPRSVGSVAGYHPIRIAAFDSDSGNAAAKLMRRSRRFSKECDDVRYYCPPQAGWDSEDSSVSEEDQSSGSERSPSAAEAHVSACSVLDYEPSADSALSDGSALMGGRTFGFLHKPLELALTAREQPPKPQGFTFGHSGSAGPCFGSAPVPFGSAPRSFVSAAGYFPPPPEPVALEEPVSVLQAVASDRRRHPAQIAAFDSDSGNAAAEVMRRRSLSSEMVAERLERKPSAYVRTNIERQRRYNVKMLIPTPCPPPPPPQLLCLQPDVAEEMKVHTLSDMISVQFPPLDTALVKQKAKAPEGVFSNIKFGKQLNFLGGPCRPQVCRFRVSQLEAQQHKWTQIFKLQDSDGYWELTTELGQLIHLNVDVFANEFLRKKGIRSLGSRAHADILRMIATLMVLQLMRVEQLEEGKLLRNLFHLEEASGLRPERWDQVKKAVDWVRWADWQYPCICSRLELGLSWESCTRQLLGFNKLPSFSPLTGLDLRVH